MPNLSQRSLEKELLDGKDIPFDDIALNMQELNTINTILGGHAISLTGFKSLSKNRNKISVCEIGCGGGDNLLVILNYCQKNGIEVSLTGIDMNKECIQFAQSNQRLKPYTRFINSDYSLVKFNEKPDIIFSSLFCHHFNNSELVYQLEWMQKNSQIGFFINDLQRHKLAYYSIKWLTKFFSKSRLVKNDAPLSVARGFHKSEWKSLFKLANLKVIDIEWKWAFRYLIIFKHGEGK